MPDSQRRPTLKDVAQEAGVSRATASLVIRGAAGPSAAARERVRAAAETLGYRPDTAAQALRRRSSGLIGVTFRTGAPFHSDVIEQLYPAAEALGYDLVLSAVVPTRDERRAIDALIASRCEALVLIGPTDVDANIPGDVPVVGIGLPGTPGLDAVYMADRLGYERLTDHLIELGHRRIVHIDGSASSGAAERQEGFRNAMTRAGLTPVVLPGDNTEHAGSQAAQHLLRSQKPLPSAVMAVNDQSAAGLLMELRRAGIDVPGRLSVTGYDDSRVARLAHVDLTTVRQDAVALAATATKLIRERLTETADRGPRTVELEPELVIRGTTAPPHD